MKKITAIVLCIAVMLALALPVGAENYLYSNYTIGNDGLVCMGNALPLGAQISVKANGQEIAGATVSTVSAEELPVTYICVVDCSSGLSMVQKQQQMDILETVSTNLRSIDEMYLFYMTDSLEFGECLKTAEERNAAIHADFPAAYSTALYDSILRSLRKVNNEEKFPNLKCMIVMSDGLDDRRGNGDTSDVQNAILEDEICLNTVVLLDNYPDPYVVSRGQTLADLAGKSHGGESFVMNVDAFTAREAAVKIVENMMTSAIIKLNPDDLDRSAENVEVSVSYKTENAADSGTVLVPTKLLPPVTVKETEPETTAPTTEPETVPETTTPPTEPKVESTANILDDVLNTPGMALLIGIGVVTVLGVLVAIILHFRKEEPEETVPSDLEFMDIPDNFLAKQRTAEKVEKLDLEISVPVVDKPAPPKQPEENSSASDTGFTLVLVREDNGTPVLTCHMPEKKSISVGRNERADYILDASDNNLSGSHFELKWDGSNMYLRDKSFTNSTLLNGKAIPPQEWVRITGEKIITAGSFRYLVRGKREAIQ